jgi:hypothetical protein
VIPIEVEIVIPTLTTLGFGCRKCTVILDQAGVHAPFRDSSWDEYPEDWKQDMKRISDWIEKASQLYKHRIRIRIVDAYSLLGVWKQLRHRAPRTPAFIVDGKSVHVGWNTENVESLIDERIREAAAQQEARVRDKSQKGTELGL